MNNLRNCNLSNLSIYWKCVYRISENLIECRCIQIVKSCSFLPLSQLLKAQGRMLFLTTLILFVLPQICDFIQSLPNSKLQYDVYNRNREKIWPIKPLLEEKLKYKKWSWSLIYHMILPQLSYFQCSSVICGTEVTHIIGANLVDETPEKLCKK